MKKLYFLITSLFIAGSASAAIVNISQSGFTFSPMTANVVVGDIIHFTWASGVHTTTSVTVPAGADTWDAPLDAGNTSFDYEVMVPGNYAYHCIFHSNMVGGFNATVASQVEPVLTSNEAATFNAGVDYNTRSLHIAVDNSSPSHAVLRMIDITGKEVAVLFDTQLGMGEQRFHFDMSGRNAGIYFLRLEQNGKVVTRKVLMN